MCLGFRQPILNQKKPDLLQQPLSARTPLYRKTAKQFTSQNTSNLNTIGLKWTFLKELAPVSIQCLPGYCITKTHTLGFVLNLSSLNITQTLYRCTIYLLLVLKTVFIYFDRMSYFRVNRTALQITQIIQKLVYALKCYFLCD